MGTVGWIMWGVTSAALAALAGFLWGRYPHPSKAPHSHPTPADVEAFVALPEQRIAQEIPEIETRLAKHPRFKDLPSADRKAAAEELAQKAAMHLGRYRRGV